jgi:CheY-like chemotaxis protein
MKLLIVDDNYSTRNLIRSIMKPYGHVIVETENGIDAVNMYASELPDCVLMDYEMEGMNGIKATETIKASFPNARIIIVTMFDDEYLREAATKAGAERYVLKEELMDLPGILEG